MVRKTKCGKLHGDEIYSVRLVKIWSRVLSPLVGKSTTGLSWKTFTADWSKGRSVLLKSPASTIAQLGYFISKVSKDDIIALKVI
jgi:hypothetical protein